MPRLLQISIVIPTYHRNDLLARCLDRLTPGQQTIDPQLYEVIVTDDGSSTNSEDMIRDAYPWVRWIAGPKRGPAANRNHGIRQSSADWIALTDDDCVPSASWLSAYLSAIDTSDPIDTLEGRTTCDDGVPSLLFQAPINLSGGNLFTCNMALSRRVFGLTGGFDERFPHASQEDIEFYERLKRNGYKVHFVPDAVVDHPPRKRQTGKSSGLLWEGKVLIETLVGRKLTEPLAWHVFKVRTSEIRLAPLHRDTLRFAWSSLVEIGVVAWNAKKWVGKYKGFRQHKPLASSE